METLICACVCDTDSRKITGIGSGPLASLAELRLDSFGDADSLTPLIGFKVAQRGKYRMGNL
eukprot:9163523-Karenia_brevis.AAC.1